MGLLPVIIALNAAGLFGVSYGLYVIVVGRVEYLPGRKANGIAARIMGLVFVAAVIAIVVIALSFFPED